MNYIQHLNTFFARVEQDERLNPSHVSLYVSVFHYWNRNHFQNPVSVSRSQLMRISKIGSLATYHKCIRELHHFGYLRYVPSYNPFRGSWVYLAEWGDESATEQKPDISETGDEQAVNPYPFTADAGNEQVLDKQQTSAEQALVPSINSLNLLNSLNNTDMSVYGQTTCSESELGSKCEQVASIPAETISIEKREKERKEKSCAKKEKKAAEQIPPPLEQVQAFFRLEQYPEPEARKFFHYFESNGWKVGGKAPMRNWQSAAHTWMFNASTHRTHGNNQRNPPAKPVPGRLQVATDKDYSEPL